MLTGFAVPHGQGYRRRFVIGAEKMNAQALRHLDETRALEQKADQYRDRAMNEFKRVHSNEATLKKQLQEARDVLKEAGTGGRGRLSRWWNADKQKEASRRIEDLQKTIATTKQRRIEWQQRTENEINQQKAALQRRHANEVAILSPPPLSPEQTAERDRRSAEARHAVDAFRAAESKREKREGQEKTTDTGRTLGGPEVKP